MNAGLRFLWAEASASVGTRLLIAGAVGLLIAPHPVSAQGAAASTANVEVGFSIGIDGGTKFGRQDATLTANGTGRTTRSFVLFGTSTEMRPARHVGGRVAVPVGGLFFVEGAVSLHQPSIVTTIQSDFERTGDTFSIEERLSRYLVEANVLFPLEGLSFSAGRGLPFVDAGASYLRDVHEGRASADTGRSLHAGAGLKYYFRSRPDRFFKVAGLRVDGRLEFVSRGFNPGGELQRRGSGAAGVFVGF